MMVDWSTKSEEAMERDPREYPYGYLTGGSFVMDSLRVFVWFRTVDDLLVHLRDVEPRIYGVVPGEGLEEFQAELAPILEDVRAHGLSEPLRRRIDAAVRRAFVVDWWGTYPELRSGRGAIPRRLLDAFLGESREGDALVSGEEDAFVAFLRTAGI